MRDWLTAVFFLAAGLVLTCAELRSADRIEKVLSISVSSSSFAWKSQDGFSISSFPAETKFSDDAGFHWTLPAPFRVYQVVEFASGSQIIAKIVKRHPPEEVDSTAALMDQSISRSIIKFEHACLVWFRKSGTNWVVVAPLLGDFIESEGRAIGLISAPLDDPTSLIVNVSRLGEKVGGMQHVIWEWRYLNFETGTLGEVFTGEVMPVSNLDQ